MTTCDNTPCELRVEGLSVSSGPCSFIQAATRVLSSACSSPNFQHLRAMTESKTAHHAERADTRSGAQIYDGRSVQDIHSYTIAHFEARQAGWPEVPGQKTATRCSAACFQLQTPVSSPWCRLRPSPSWIPTHAHRLCLWGHGHRRKTATRTLTRRIQRQKTNHADAARAAGVRCVSVPLA